MPPDRNCNVLKSIKNIIWFPYRLHEIQYRRIEWQDRVFYLCYAKAIKLNKDWIFFLPNLLCTIATRFPYYIYTIQYKLNVSNIQLGLAFFLSHSRVNWFQVFPLFLPPFFSFVGTTNFWRIRLVSNLNRHPRHSEWWCTNLWKITGEMKRNIYWV